MCVGKTLNMDSYYKFWGNLEGIWGNPGEIPHIGWKIPGVNDQYMPKGISVGRMFSTMTITLVMAPYNVDLQECHLVYNIKNLSCSYEIIRGVGWAGPHVACRL